MSGTLACGATAHRKARACAIAEYMASPRQAENSLWRGSWLLRGPAGLLPSEHTSNQPSPACSPGSCFACACEIPPAFQNRHTCYRATLTDRIYRSRQACLLQIHYQLVAHRALSQTALSCMQIRPLPASLFHWHKP